MLLFLSVCNTFFCHSTRWLSYVLSNVFLQYTYQGDIAGDAWHVATVGKLHSTVRCVDVVLNFRQIQWCLFFACTLRIQMLKRSEDWDPLSDRRWHGCCEVSASCCQNGHHFGRDCGAQDLNIQDLHLQLHICLASYMPPIWNIQKIILICSDDHIVCVFKQQ